MLYWGTEMDAKVRAQLGEPTSWTESIVGSSGLWERAAERGIVSIASEQVTMATRRSKRERLVNTAAYRLANLVQSWRQQPPFATIPKYINEIEPLRSPDAEETLFRLEYLRTAHMERFYSAIQGDHNLY